MIMSERKFIDICYDKDGKFIYPCIICKKTDKDPQGDFWGCDYLCSGCSKTTGEKWASGLNEPS